MAKSARTVAAREPASGEAVPGDTAAGVPCRVLSPIKTSGRRFEEGDAIVLPDAVFDELEALGAVARTASAPD
jgi:hypothetical protein